MLIHRLALAPSALAAALLGTIPAGTSVVDPVTIPTPAASAEGNSDNLYPFNGNPMRYQQVIAASEFPAGLRTITRIALRPDTFGGSAFSETLGHVRITLSTTAKVPGTLSLTFADNLGADEVVVFDGELDLSSAFTGPDAGPKDMDIIIDLTTPFAYDPSRGALLLDVKNFTGGRTTQLDAHDDHDSTARVWSDDVNSDTARDDDLFPSVGLVLRFLSD